jgi:hypothetical protein
MRCEARRVFCGHHDVNETLANMTARGWQLVTVLNPNDGRRELYFQRKARPVPLHAEDGLLLRDSAPSAERSGNNLQIGGGWEN